MTRLTHAVVSERAIPALTAIAAPTLLALCNDSHAWTDAETTIVIGETGGTCEMRMSRSLASGVLVTKTFQALFDTNGVLVDIVSPPATQSSQLLLEVVGH